MKVYTIIIIIFIIIFVVFTMLKETVDNSNKKYDPLADCKRVNEMFDSEQEWLKFALIDKKAVELGEG